VLDTAALRVQARPSRVAGWLVRAQTTGGSNMATLAGTEKSLNHLLRDLIELDYDAIEAYKAAIERLKQQADRTQLGVFLEDHRRHVADLSAYLRQLGVEPPVSGDIKRVLTKGKVVVLGLMGDKAIFEAMKSNEDDTNRAYERAVGADGLTADLRSALDRNLADERRHRAWFEARISAMTASR
jgi:uncharacterized protein (TIGR02284 family)